jgi:hypothetical protein
LAERYAEAGHFVPVLGALVLELLACRRGEVADLLRPVLIDETGTWVADYVPLRFRAVRAGLAVLSRGARWRQHLPRSC